MLRKWLCQLDVTLQLQPIDPVLIKSGYATVDGPDMVPVSTLRNGNTTYFFPGSSLKGVLRSHFERIARTLAPGSVCLPYYDPNRRNQIAVPVAEEQDSFGCGFRAPANGGPDSSTTAYRESCAACRLFGSLRFAGRFSIGDAYPLPGHQPTQGKRNGVGIDRFTGGTVHGALFDLIVVEGGLFETNLRVTNFELWQLAAINSLLQDLADEMIYVGSGRSRGLGRVKGTVTRYVLSYIRAQTAVAGLAEMANEQERNEYGLVKWEPPKSIPLGNGTSRGLRQEYDMANGWSERLQPLSGSLESFLESHAPLRNPNVRGE
jgi:CRISPR-associated RAMP protein (TIGR02581 family)